MQIYTSYFYQVRFMKPHMIPLSTAIYGPAWFKQGHPWKDKNGVWNGLRAEPFAPGPLCEGQCQGKDRCNGKPQSCGFLQNYYKQLNLLDYNDIIARCERIGNYIKSIENFPEEPIIMLLVHEAPSNPCSERVIIQKWFADHAQNVVEWQH